MVVFYVIVIGFFGGFDYQVDCVCEWYVVVFDCFYGVYCGSNGFFVVNCVVVVQQIVDVCDFEWIEFGVVVEYLFFCFGGYNVCVGQDVEFVRVGVWQCNFEDVVVDVVVFQVEVVCYVFDQFVECYDGGVFVLWNFVVMYCWQCDYFFD